MSGIVNISADAGMAYGSVNITVKTRGSNVPTTMITDSTNALCVVVGGGGNGSGKLGPITATAGKAGVVSNYDGVVSDLLIINGNKGEAAYRTHHNDAHIIGSKGGSYATSSCKYGGGHGAGDYTKGNPNTTYNPGYGYVRMVRIGD